MKVIIILVWFLLGFLYWNTWDQQQEVCCPASTEKTEVQSDTQASIIPAEKGKSQATNLSANNLNFPLYIYFQEDSLAIHDNETSHNFFNTELSSISALWQLSAFLLDGGNDQSDENDLLPMVDYLKDSLLSMGVAPEQIIVDSTAMKNPDPMDKEKTNHLSNKILKINLIKLK
jgi:hypothetical protein